MKISDEAREAASDLLAVILTTGGKDRSIYANAMQSLINSTLERAAGVADGNIMSGNDQWCAGHDAAARRIASAIRALII